MRRLINRTLGGFFLLSLSVAAFAQTGQFSGNVSDPQQAMVAGAQVRVVNQTTKYERAVKTNSDGSYVVPFVQPGTYKIFVEAPGFVSAVSDSLTLTVGQELVFNAQLTIGGTRQEVTVSTGSQLLNTTDGSVSTIIDRQFVENIPLNGRSIQDLIALTPGVVTPLNGYEGDFTVNGQRTESNNYMVDGVSANTGLTLPGTAGPGVGGNLSAQTALGTSQSLLSVDALQEFRVMSSSYSAEYGRDPGGQFILTSRSGTNAYHGSGFDYLRNNFFDANNWFNDYYHVSEPALRQNNFGGTFGGPVRIPKLYNGKDKTFFFVSYEGLQLVQPQAASAQYVPTLAIRQMAAPALQPMLNAFPLPTGPDQLVACSTSGAATVTPCPAGVPSGTNVDSGLAAYNMATSSPSSFNSTSVRIDQNFSPKLTVFFRFGDTPSLTQSQSESALNITHSNSTTSTFGATSQFSSTLGNNFRLNYTTNALVNTAALNGFGGATAISLAQAMGVGSYPNALPVFFDYVAGVGYASLTTLNRSTDQHQWNVVDTVSKTFGQHLLKFGFDYRRITSPLFPYNPQLSGYFYNQQALETNTTYLLLIAAHLPSAPVFNDSAAFVQDEWHVSRRLSLSLGLRWDVDPPPSSRQNDALNITGCLCDPATLGVAPRGTPLWKTSYFNFAPRLGVAWELRTTPGWETVLRAGGGVFFDTDNEAAGWGFSGGLGDAASARYSGLSLPVTTALVNSVVPSTAPPYTSGSINALPQHLQLPYTLQWNVAVQQSLGKAQAFTVTYVGAAGRRLILMQTLNLSSLNPNFGTIDYLPPGVTSDYDALQLQFQRRLSRGLQVLGSYTWSHSIDDGSAAFEIPYQRGNSDFDLRQNFQAGVSWNLPDVQGNAFVKQAFSHWGLDGRLIARTGFPVEIAGNFLTDPANGSNYYSGVNVNPGVPIYLYGAYPGGREINSAAFSLPTGNNSGDAARNFVRGFGEVQINLAVRREFVVREGLRLQFRAEAFNILNHPNFGNINATLNTATFGQASATLNTSFSNPLAQQYEQGGPRSMQFALKLIF